MGATAKDLHVDKVLTQMAQGYQPEGMIAGMIMPMVLVDKQTDIYLEADRADILRRPENTLRAPGNEARLISQNFGSNTYRAINYALKASVTIEDKANTDVNMIFGKAESKAQLVLDKLFLDWEVRVTELVTNTSNVGSFSAVASAWNLAGAPLDDINTAIDNVRYSNGVMPNRVIFGPQAWDSFRRDSTVRDLIKGANNGGGYVNEAEVQNLLNIKNVMVAGAFQNTGDDGQAESVAPIWLDHVLVYYVPDSPTIDRPSFAYSFRWQQANLPAALVVERHPYNSRTKSEEVEAGYYQDEKITGASYAFIITAVNSST